MDDVIRVRVDGNKKAALNEIYDAKGTTLSEEVRKFLDAQLLAESDVVERFDALMDSVDEQLEAYGAPEPTVDDIVSYVDGIRAQRIQDAAA